VDRLVLPHHLLVRLPPPRGPAGAGAPAGRSRRAEEAAEGRLVTATAHSRPPGRVRDDTCARRRGELKLHQLAALRGPARGVAPSPHASSQPLGVSAPAPVALPVRLVMMIHLPLHTYYMYFAAAMLL
jgi:hypothetical protein